MFFVISVFAATAVKAQTAKITLPAKKVTISAIFSAIEKQSDYLVVYENADINVNKTVTLSAATAQMNTILGAVAKSTGTKYEVSNKYIVFSKPGAAKATAVSSKGNVKVTGKVLDSAGEPVIGATVMEKGTNNGTATDLDGNFTLNVSGANSVVAVSYVGCVDSEMRVTPGKPMTFSLKESAENLDELVVVGYGVQKKVNLSGAVSTVETKQLENRPVLNVGNALQGAVANLNVTVGTGQAISTPSFNIRGTNSINGGSPLVVIDGVASDAGALNRMNPNDIESMSVLKDAASCAIYGAKAAYGVILVTTKAGKSEKLTVNYNNNFTFTTNTKMPEIITDPYKVVTTRNIMAYPWYNLYNEEQIEYAKKVSEDPTMSPYFLTPGGTYQYFGQTDWIDECYKDFSFATNHSVDISGKTDRVDYYFSAGYNYQNGMIKYNTDTYNRYNVNSKLSFHLTDNWTLSNNTVFTTYDYKAPTNLSSDTYWAINRICPLDVPKNPDGTWTSSGVNPLGLLQDGGDWQQYSTRVRTQFNSRFDIIKNVLFLQGSFAYTSNKSRERWFYAPVAYTDGPDRPIKYQNPISSASSSNGDSKSTYLDLYATFHKKFAGKHDVNVMVGFNQEEYEYYNSSLSRKELISTSVPAIGLATGEKGVGESMGSKATRSGFGRIGYIFDDKYIVEFNGRYDGTSIFPKNDRFVFSPSGSLAWVVSKEKFFAPVKDVVSFLKLRGSYGKLGNQDLSSYYPYLATMGSGQIGAIIEGEQPVAVYAPGLVSGSLTWEKVSTLDFGADINFWDNRISVSGDYYVRRTKDMLTAGKPLPVVLGTSVPTANAADLKTKGWEITVGYRDQFKVMGKPLNLAVNFNIADSRAWITKFDNPSGTLSNYYVGYEMGTMWGLVTEGFFTSDEDIKNHANQNPVTSYPGMPPTAAGDLKFKDIDEDGIINGGAWTLEDHGDYTIIGNTRNRYTYGINIAADWNGFDFSVFLQGVGKKDYYPGSGDLFFWGVYAQPWTNISYGNYYDHWTEENPNGYFPRQKSYVAFYTEAAIAQTRYKQNAAYLRLKNLSFGYTLPKVVTDKLNITRLRVFFSGDNLAVWSGLYKYYKLDPEGLGGGGYPLQKAISCGFNLTF
ncbi:MAG: SusC/RagA family TonB-linked outer membrane protein [Muribaculaceae bacterium]